MLTGIGGDELLGPRCTIAPRCARRQASSRASRHPPRRSRASPHRLQRAVLTRRPPVALPWLRRRAQRLFRPPSRTSAWMLLESVTERLTWVRHFAYLDVLTAALGLTANDCDVLLVHPLLSVQLWPKSPEPRCRSGSPGGPTAAPAVRRPASRCHMCARQQGAVRRRVLDRPGSRVRAVVRRAGIPDEWVDPEALADHWHQERPLANSFTLLQACWLASEQGVEQAFDRVVTDSQRRGRRSVMNGSALSSMRASGFGGYRVRPRWAPSSRRRSEPCTGDASVRSSQRKETQPPNGSSAGTEPSIRRHRSRVPTIPTARRRPIAGQRPREDRLIAGRRAR